MHRAKKGEKSVEAKTRELDRDKSLSMNEASRRIANKIGANFRTVRNYVVAHRRGFESYRHLEAQRAGFSSVKEYHDNLAQQRGFQDENSYILVLGILNNTRKKSKRTLAQQTLEAEIEVEHMEDFLGMPAYESPDSRFSEVQQVMKKLTPNQREVLQLRINGLTLQQAGEVLTTSYQTVNNLETDAIMKIRTHLGIEKPNIEHEEILLAHVLSRFFGKGNKCQEIAGVMNEIMSEETGRTYDEINVRAILKNSNRQTLRKRFFPRPKKEAA